MTKENENVSVANKRNYTEEEINARRNLALNPFDLRGNDNGVPRHDGSPLPRILYRDILNR